MDLAQIEEERKKLAAIKAAQGIQQPPAWVDPETRRLEDAAKAAGSTPISPGTGPGINAQPMGTPGGLGGLITGLFGQGGTPQQAPQEQIPVQPTPAPGAVAPPPVVQPKVPVNPVAPGSAFTPDDALEKAAKSVSDTIIKKQDIDDRTFWEKSYDTVTSDKDLLMAGLIVLAGAYRSPELGQNGYTLFADGLQQATMFYAGQKGKEKDRDLDREKITSAEGIAARRDQTDRDLSAADIKQKNTVGNKVTDAQLESELIDAKAQQKRDPKGLSERQRSVIEHARQKALNSNTGNFLTNADAQDVPALADQLRSVLPKGGYDDIPTEEQLEMQQALAGEQAKWTRLNEQGKKTATQLWVASQGSDEVTARRAQKKYEELLKKAQVQQPK
jgi:hypothetical protein